MPGEAQAVDWQNDPDFQGLPLAEKHKVLLSIDPDYRGLPPQEQVEALDAIHYGPRREIQPESWGESARNALAAAPGVVARQVEGGIESLGAKAIAPYREGYQAYRAAKQAGQGTGAALGKAALTGIATATPGYDDALTARQAAQEYPERRAAGYGRIYSAEAPLVANQVGVNLPGMKEAAAEGKRLAIPR